jgi:hypothetical protein
VAQAAHALYFDWSDLVFKTILCVVVVVAAVRWPTVAAALACVLLAITLTAHLAFAAAVPEWASSAKAGDTWRSVETRLGVPTYSFASLDEASRHATGYAAAPSPWRYRQSGPVAVFTGGDHALWVFHQYDSVQATFVRGS